MTTDVRFKELRNQVCECSHGAGWHGGVLASSAWAKEKQTDLPCDHDDCAQSGDKCAGFKLKGAEGGAKD